MFFRYFHTRNTILFFVQSLNILFTIIYSDYACPNKIASLLRPETNHRLSQASFIYT